MAKGEPIIRYLIMKPIKNTPKQKFMFDVVVTCMLPATLTYKILAEDAEQAAMLIKGKQPNAIVHKLSGRKELKLKVYNAGSLMIKFIKNLF